MRLQEVYSICKNVQEEWCSLSFEEKKIPGGVYYRLINADRIRYILATLEEIESFSECISSIKIKSPGFEQVTGDITIEQRSKSNLEAAYHQLENKVVTITELFESLNYKQNSSGFDIKLPPDITLSDLSKCTKDLSTIFSTCPLFSNAEGTITFSSVDVGSVWLSFVVGGAATIGILTMIAALVDKALIIRSHRLTTKEQSEKIRTLQLSNDILENANEVNKTITKSLLDKVSTDLANDHNITEPEDIGRLKTSIQLLSDWMNKGMEIYAAVEAPTETKAVFPSVEVQSLPENTLALLTSGNDSTEE